ncbi:EamA family transporter [Paeniglutamicibacter sp. R2-26]|uniref:EamA family transporter n=1 Tax=Paeniglutamicibacter sp. R2-26 TaxID=3144417 RepID=UPI003EE71DF1
MLLNHSPRKRALWGTLCVLVGSIGIQLSSVLASNLFDVAGTLGTSALRLAAAAAVLLLIARPRLRGLGRRAWASICLYGVAMAAMNALLYNALEHVPLGTAVTLEFLGPLAIAAMGARGKLERLLPVATLLGVALVAGPLEGINIPGIAYGLGAAVAFGAYTLLAGRVGDTTPGLQGLALSVTVAALVIAPFSIQAAPRLDGPEWLTVVASALLGVALAYTLDFVATKLTSPRIVGTLFAIDPAAAALIGALALNQVPGFSTLLGIALVIVSGAAIIWLSGRPRSVPEPEPEGAVHGR